MFYVIGKILYKIQNNKSLCLHGSLFVLIEIKFLVKKIFI